MVSVPCVKYFPLYYLNSLVFYCLFLSSFLSGLPWGLQLHQNFAPVEVYLLLCCFFVQIIFYTLHDHQHRFIVIILCNCLLNWVRRNLQKIYLHCFLCYVVILPMLFISLHGFELLSHVFHLGLKDPLQYFLWDRSVNNGFSVFIYLVMS